MKNRSNLNRFSLASLLLLGVVSTQASADREAPHPFAIIINPKVSVDNLSMADLRKVWMGDRPTWSSGQRIGIYIRSKGSPEFDVLLKRVYQMTEGQYRQFWIAKVFRSEAASDPKIVNSNQSAADIVGRSTGAISCVDAQNVPKGVKVLKIDGHNPTEKGYPLE